MTAHELIAGIFSRPQQGVSSNLRFVTERQFNYLKDLIGMDEEGAAAVQNGMNGGLVWMPSGRVKYVLSYDPGSGKRSITKLGVLHPTGEGRLFS